MAHRSTWRLAVNAYRVKTNKVPKGFQTILQIAAELNESITGTRDKIRPLVQHGKVECQKFRIHAGGRLYLVPHYRLKKAVDRK